MTEFVELPNSRAAQLLRMAGDTDVRSRRQIIQYAESTPVPVMGPHGISTRGCPACRRTMWRQQDATGLLWVCGSCGHVVDEEAPVAETAGRSAPVDPDVLRMLDEAIADRGARRGEPSWRAENARFAEANEHWETGTDAVHAYLRALDGANADATVIGPRRGADHDGPR